MRISSVSLTLCVGCFVFVECFKYYGASQSELDLITNEGKQLLESLTEKVKLPQFGSCWKDAISDLQLGCKFLSEDVQSDIALRFTDCFLQMSGYEPMICMNAKDVCLRNLSDRAFNAYTEFYTHTQSICYFLQSQVWHEEAQKTIGRLSDASMLVTAQLEEAGHIQKNILNQQKESIVLQHYLLDNGKTIASALEISEEKISKIMKDFEDSATEQKKVLFELFEKITLLRSWVIGEMSWVNSVLFYVSSLIIAYLFTSVPITKKARLYILLALTVNYFTERFIYSHIVDQILNEENLISWIWLSRKVFIVISVIILIHSAIMYCDYNIINHNLLKEIRNQNKRILSNFERSSAYIDKKLYSKNVTSGMNLSHIQREGEESTFGLHSAGSSCMPKNLTVSPVIFYSSNKEKNPILNHHVSGRQHKTSIDDIDYVSLESDKPKTKTLPVKRDTPYNLRSSIIRK